jgi:hypothetical protein
MNVRIGVEADFQRITRMGDGQFGLETSIKRMPISLIFIFVVNAMLQFSTGEVGDAVMACIFLGLFMYIAYAFGGWTSLRGMKFWLRQHPHIAMVLVFADLFLLFLLFTPEIGSVAERVSLVIQGAFFYYAGASIFCTLFDKMKAQFSRK